MWEVGGGGGGGGGSKDAGYCEDANLMHPTSLLGHKMRARFHFDPRLQHIESGSNLCMSGAATGCHDSLAYTFTVCSRGALFLRQTVYNV